jgi:hypothetical protein
LVLMSSGGTGSRLPQLTRATRVVLSAVSGFRHVGGDIVADRAGGPAEVRVVWRVGSRGLVEADFEEVAVFLDRGIKIAAEVSRAVCPLRLRPHAPSCLLPDPASASIRLPCCLSPASVCFCARPLLHPSASRAHSRCSSMRQNQGRVDWAAPEASLVCRAAALASTSCWRACRWHGPSRSPALPRRCFGPEQAWTRVHFPGRTAPLSPDRRPCPGFPLPVSSDL